MRHARHQPNVGGYLLLDVDDGYLCQAIHLSLGRVAGSDWSAWCIPAGLSSGSISFFYAVPDNTGAALVVKGSTAPTPT
ncbi:MAG TPA: hypothetical protein VMO47_04065, partial [Rhodothermales bacterium]|nr:hypothetical protein [Rhodothermales bacterium]